ncbi:MAG: Hpt domain-containing protein [Candidatus Omnitrophota bacterium]
MSEGIINISDALERVQDDRELLLELFDIFQQDFEEKRQEIGRCLESKNFEQMKDIAHSLKGASGNISAERIYVPLSELEQIAGKGDLPQINSLIKIIDQRYEELKKHIVKLKKELR